MRKLLLVPLSLWVAAAVVIVVGMVGAHSPHAAAQAVPPSPPATFYGTVTGVPAGSTVLAIVVNGSTTVVCGEGTVATEGSQTVYVVDVVHESQRQGCGASGRSVRFYFPGSPPSAPGRLAAETGTWNMGPVERNLTVGTQLNNTVVVAGLSKQ